MNTARIEFKWALIFALTTLAWTAIEKTSGLHDVKIAQHEQYALFFTIPAFVIYVFSMLDKKRNGFGGKMSFRQGFGSGLLLSAFIALLSPLTMYLSLRVISPDFLGNMIRYIVEKGFMKQDQAELYFNLRSYIIQGIANSMGMGVFISAITAFFVKSRT